MPKTWIESEVFSIYVLANEAIGIRRFRDVEVTEYDPPLEGLPRHLGGNEKPVRYRFTQRTPGRILGLRDETYFSEAEARLALRTVIAERRATLLRNLTALPSNVDLESIVVEDGT